MKERKVRRVQRRGADRRLIFPGIVLFVALCACDVRRGGPEPIAECLEYASKADVCLGERLASRLRASYSKPPEAREARDEMRAQCIAKTAHLRRLCR